MNLRSKDLMLLHKITEKISSDESEDLSNNYNIYEQPKIVKYGPMYNRYRKATDLESVATFGRKRSSIVREE